jgi:hypothetical protein
MGKTAGAIDGEHARIGFESASKPMVESEFGLE